MGNQIDKIVKVVITRQTTVPSMASFNDVLIVGEFTVSGFDADHRVEKYSSLSAMQTAGFSTTSYAYRACQAVFAQSPHIDSVYVGWKNVSETWTDALNAIKTQNNKWYGLCVETRRMADQQLVASWVQSNKKLCILASGDSTIINATTGDIGAYVKAQSYDRTAVFYHPDCDDTIITNYTVYSNDGLTFYTDPEMTIEATIPSGVTPTFVSGTEYTYSVTTYGLNDNDPIPEACLFGKMFTKRPGSATWALKTFQGMSAYDLTDSQVEKAHDKNVNTYMYASDVAVTQDGKTGGEFIDVIHGCDWLEAYIQNQVFANMISVDKVPFTDIGIQMIVDPLKSALNVGVDYELITEYDVTHPRASEVSKTDKGKRHLPDVRFTAPLAGAIQSTQIDGVVTL